jgi:drug/metabolite transporter (DMT)-like permease
MLFGLSAVLAIGLELSASAIVAGRAIWAALTLTLVLLVIKPSQLGGWSRRDIHHLLVNGVLLAGHWICFFIGVEQGGVAVGTLGFACFPIFVSLLGWIFFNSAISKRDVFSILFVFAGLVIISPSSLGSEKNGYALIWAVVAGLSYAVIVLYNHHIETKASPIQSSWLQCITCAFITLPWGYPDLISMSSEDFIKIMTIGVLCTGIAYSLLTFSLRKINAGKAAIIIALEPVWAIFFSAIWFNTIPALNILIGGLLIITAVIFSSLPKRTPCTGKHSMIES